MRDAAISSGNIRERRFRIGADKTFRNARKEALRELQPFLKELDRIDRDASQKGPEAQIWRRKARQMAIDRYQVRDTLLRYMNGASISQLEIMADSLTADAMENAEYVLKGEMAG